MCPLRGMVSSIRTGCRRARKLFCPPIREDESVIDSSAFVVRQIRGFQIAGLNVSMIVTKTTPKRITNNGHQRSHQASFEELNSISSVMSILTEKCREAQFPSAWRFNGSVAPMSQANVQGLSLALTVSTRCLRAGTSIATLFRPTWVDTGGVFELALDSGGLSLSRGALSSSFPVMVRVSICSVFR